MNHQFKMMFMGAFQLWPFDFAHVVSYIMEALGRKEAFFYEQDSGQAQAPREIDRVN